MMRSIGLVLLGLSLVAASYNMGHNQYDMPVASYAASSYAAPSYGSYQQDYDVKQIVDYKYAINDYYGNEQSKREHIDDYGINGEYQVRLPDGRHETVTYDSGPYGHLAQVDIVQDYATPSYSAPSYSAPSYGYSAPAYSKPAPYVYQSFHQRMIPIKKYHAPTYAAPSYAAPTYNAPSHY